MTSISPYMQRALDLAEKGVYHTSPNPMVGCVIVYEDKIIGEGFHAKFGGPHAEVEALRSVVDKDVLSKSTMYVTLEPCSHYGKTPPCTLAIKNSGIKKVVIGCLDPNPAVGGKGVQALKQQGIQCELEDANWQIEYQNRRFFTFHRKKRPYIFLKWAQSSNGYLGLENQRIQISSNESKYFVHKWRSTSDAVVVGSNTLFTDNPNLTVRDWLGSVKYRIALIGKRGAKKLKKTENTSDLNLLQSHNTTQTILYLDQSIELSDSIKTVELDPKNLQEVLTDMYDRNIVSIFVEGGSALLNQFIENDLWDQAAVFISPKWLNEGVEAPKLPAAPRARQQIMQDSLYWFFNTNTQNSWLRL